MPDPSHASVHLPSHTASLAVTSQAEGEGRDERRRVTLEDRRRAVVRGLLDKRNAHTWLNLRRFRDERVVGTSTPGDWCEPGTIYQWREGHPWYRITRVVRVGPTRLLDGSLMPHYQVMGVEIPAPPPEARGPQFRTVLSLGDLDPGESVSVPLDRSAGWQTLVRSDPSPMPSRFHLFGGPRG